MNPLLEAALEWAELGVCLVPCQGKNPGTLLGDDWPRKASRDEARLREWWERWPNANVGVVPGETLLLLDVDDPEAFAQLEQTLGPAPPTPRYYTNGTPGTLRERLVFRHPGVELRKSALGAGLELRAGDLMSVVPPSVNPKSGEPYEWRTALDEAPLCAFPDYWLAQEQNGVGPAPEIPERIPYGVQHDTLVSFAGTMRRRGARANEIAAALKELNKRCERPGTAEEMERIAASVQKYPPHDVPERVSFLSATKGYAVAERNFLSVPEALKASDQSPSVVWAWRGYIATGTTTLLAGRPKVGKSTFLTAVVRAVTEGEPFLERSTAKTGVVLLTEERLPTLREKLERFGLGETVTLLLRSRLPPDYDWPQVVQAAVAVAKKRGAGVLVVDVLDKWAKVRGEQENAAGAMLEALAPLDRAAASGLAVVIVTHQRKAGGSHGEAVRGTNALIGGVDVVLELERARGNVDPAVRILRAESRFDSAPPELALRLGDEGYESCGTEAMVKAEHECAQVAALLSEEPRTSAEIAEAAELPGATVRRYLNELVDAEKARREGAGKRGDPYTFLSANANP
jgi:Bifunctional DNA primase/polymerase, N-terminal/AAA domain/Primase C terminal 1 (PriCT-1)